MAKWAGNEAPGERNPFSTTTFLPGALFYSGATRSVTPPLSTCRQTVIRPENPDTGPVTSRNFRAVATRRYPCQTLSWSPPPGRAGPKQKPNAAPLTRTESGETFIRLTHRSQEHGGRGQAPPGTPRCAGHRAAPELSAPAVGVQPLDRAGTQPLGPASRCFTCSLGTSEPDTIANFNSFAGVGKIDGTGAATTPV